jgi:anti-sigma factor RsiW
MELTIPHLEDGTIQALLHDELPAAVRGEVERHVAQCADCRARVEHGRDEDAWVRRRLSALDAVAPAADVGRLTRTARRQAAAAWWRRAAVIVLVAGGAGVAWAVPAVRQMIARAVGGTERSLPRAGPPALPDRSPPEAPGSGIAAAPGARFVVSFEAFQERGDVRVRLAEAAEVSIIARGARVSFESREGEIVVRNRGAAADYDVEIPAAAPLVQLRAAGAQILLKQGRTVTSPARPDSSGWYVIRLRGAPR